MEAEFMASKTDEGLSAARRSRMARVMAAWWDRQVDFRRVISVAMACKRASCPGEA
jgi:hypothetical protein